MCMDKSEKIQCKGILILARYPSSYKKNKILLVFILPGANNDTIQSTTGMNQHQNCHNPQRKEMLMTITWPLMGTFNFIQKIIDHLPDSAEVKARCILNRWDGIETQKNVMHCPTCNITCVCRVTIYLILMLILQRWRTLLKKI